MRKPDDLPVNLTVEWRQVILQLAQLRSMEPPNPSTALRREELRKQAAELQMAGRTGESQCKATVIMQPTITSPS
jgi:hypothetical protein